MSKPTENEQDRDYGVVDGGMHCKKKSRTEKEENKEQPVGVTILCGDLLTCGKQYIAHQVNCTHRGEAAGLAKAVFSAYPYADCYTEDTKATTLGGVQWFSATIHKQGIINMFAQYNKGKPGARQDTELQRRSWFQSCLNRIAASPEVTEVAFPYGIGCGLAGGSWFHYLIMITHWAEAHPHLRVYVYLN